MNKFPIYYCEVSVTYTPLPKPTKSNPRGIIKTPPTNKKINTIITLQHNEEEPIDYKDFLRDISLKLSIPTNKYNIVVKNINKILHLGNTNY